VLQVGSDNDLGTGLDGRRQHVPVGWIRELESLDEGLVPGDQAVPDGSVPRSSPRATCAPAKASSEQPENY